MIYRNGVRVIMINYFDHCRTVFLSLAIHPINTVHTKTIQIQLEKEGQSYGFTVRGGDSDDKVTTRPLIVTKIRSQGPADKYNINCSLSI